MDMSRLPINLSALLCLQHRLLRKTDVNLQSLLKKKRVSQLSKVLCEAIKALNCSNTFVTTHIIQKRELSGEKEQVSFT